jgi:hypothetical protein
MDWVSVLIDLAGSHGAHIIVRSLPDTLRGAASAAIDRTLQPYSKGGRHGS